MYKFSKKSLDNLVGVHPDLRDLVQEAMALQIMDFAVNEGLRDLRRQSDLFAAGKSKTMNSKHLKQPDGFGHAVDLYPSPIDMVAVNKGSAKEIIRFGVLYGIIATLAAKNKIKIRWGGDWDGDGQTLDHTFFDAPHIELVK
jgi:peptidoglycan L-alanyl-D-glutamate endopeptidase CwlK